MSVQVLPLYLVGSGITQGCMEEVTSVMVLGRWLGLSQDDNLQTQVSLGQDERPWGIVELRNVSSLVVDEDMTTGMQENEGKKIPWHTSFCLRSLDFILKTQGTI